MIVYSFRYPRAKLSLGSVTKSLQRIKNGTIPKNPQTVDEINEAFKNKEILELFGHTLGMKDLFFDGAVKTENVDFCVFSSKKQIQLLNTHVDDKRLHLLMDATFRTCPMGPFKQFLIIYARIHHQVSFFSSLLHSICLFLSYSFFIFISSLSYHSFFHFIFPFPFPLLSLYFFLFFFFSLSFLFLFFLFSSSVGISIRFYTHV